MAGASRGSWFIPDVDDEVLVAFEAGDPRRPYVVGALWNGKDTPPESMDGAGNNFIKSITSRNGVKVTLDDQDGQEKLILETPGGQKLTMQDGPGKVEIKDSNGNSITLDTGGVKIVAAAKVTVQASTVEGQRRHGHRQRRHVQVQRRRPVRYADQQRRGERDLLARRRQYLVSNA
jgi:uncharacterized protein involved in type VI secretion and phage assembly